MKQRIAYFDNLKVLLIFFVVFGHFCEISGDHTSYGLALRMFIYSFHMPLFIFVSGLFTKKDNAEKCVNRAIGFCIIYVIMKLMAGGYHFLQGEAFHIDWINENGMPWFMLALAVWSLLAYLTRRISFAPLLLVSIAISIIIGIFPSVNRQFVISRIIVFWPYFLAGINCNKEKILEVITVNRYKSLGLIVFVAFGLAVLFLYEKIAFISPMLSGQNPYESLQEYEVYGPIIRLTLYFVTTGVSLCVMLIVPNKKLWISKYGERTLTIYVFNLLVYMITASYFYDYRVWQYFIASGFLIIITSNRQINNWLNKIINFKYVKLN